MLTEIQQATLIFATPFLGLAMIYAIGIFVVARIDPAPNEQKHTLKRRHGADARREKHYAI